MKSKTDRYWQQYRSSLPSEADRPSAYVESDRTLATWRPMYWRYIVSECRRTGMEPHPKAPLVMERFTVVYREALQEP